MSDVAREARLGQWILATLLVFFAALSEVVVRRGGAYSLADLVWPRAWLAAVFSAALAVGGWLGSDRGPRPPWRASQWLIALGWVVSVASFGVFVSFGDRSLARVALPAAALALGVALGGAASSVVSLALRLSPLRPGFVRSMSLLPAAAAVAALLGLVALIERGGPLRAGVGLGLALVALGGHGADLLAGAAAGARRVVGVSLVSAIALVPLLAVAEAFTPLSEATSWPESPAFAATGPTARLVVTSGRGAYQAYVDGTLRFSTLDAHRRREALVHPAMLAATARRSVLVLGGGDGTAAREVLRWSAVERVLVVEPDDVVLAAGRAQPVFLRENGGALSERRVQSVRQDLFAFLVSNTETFDVIVVDAAEPDTPARSKMTTRSAFKRIAARLAPGGVGVVALASPLAQRRVFSSSLTALDAAGLSSLPYHAEIPTLGLRGYALFAHAPVAAPVGALPSGLAWLDEEVLRASFRLGLDETPDRGAPPNLLHAQVGPASGDEGRRP